jgi:hypothetical protein
MPVRDTFSGEVSHLVRDKGMPQKQAVAVAYKYKRKGAFRKKRRKGRRR